MFDIRLLFHRSTRHFWWVFFYGPQFYLVFLISFYLKYKAFILLNHPLIEKYKCKTHHEICEHLLQFQQCGLVFDILSVLQTHTQTHIG